MVKIIRPIIEIMFWVLVAWGAVHLFSYFFQDIQWR